VGMLASDNDEGDGGLGACPEGVPEAAWRRIEEVVGEAARPLAVFDADGTLWADDLGETHLHVLVDGQLVAPGEGHESLLTEYAARCKANVDDAYAWGARILEGISEARVMESAVEAWRRHRPRLLPPLAQIVAALHGAGVEVVVVSASNRWVIEAAVRELGIGADKIIAVDLERDGERLTGTVVQPMPNGAGKVAAIDVHLDRRPTLAFGNSMHDVPMLQSATLGVCVLATTEAQAALSEPLEDIRAQEGWLYLGVPHPVT